MKKILFVCTANVCRSPMAAMIFNALAEDRGLPFRAESAGVRALRDEPITENGRAVLEELGVYTEGHRARQISRAILDEADIVLAMSPGQLEQLRALSGVSSREVVHSMPEYATGGSGGDSIADPYGHTLTVYRASANQLVEYIERTLDRLEREGPGRGEA